MTLEAESYLKSGSNELRVLEYTAAGFVFGINILKVKKIIKDLDSFITVPETHPAISGIFKDRGRVIPVIDLSVFFGVPAGSQKRRVVVAEFFGRQTGFWAEQVDWIHHFEWKDMIDTDSVFAGLDHKYVIGIVQPSEDRMIQMLDYESLLLDLAPHLQELDRKSYSGEEDFAGKRVLIAEDSPSVRAMLENEMTDLGFEVVVSTDGEQAWNEFQKTSFDLVISDVEMPQMDGLALTLNIRQSERKDTPVIVYSSIGDIGMKARASYLKADAHVTKLDLDQLLETANKLMRGEKIERDDQTKESIEQYYETVPV